jgi:hypothetical protein
MPDEPSRRAEPPGSTPSAATPKPLNPKPFSPLPAGEAVPTMPQLWRHAMHNYGRYQGYAWTGFVLTGVFAAALSYGIDGPSDKCASPEPLNWFLQPPAEKLTRSTRVWPACRKDKAVKR